MLDYDWYSSEVAKLAKYPRAGEGVLASVIYPTLGMAGETSEVVHKALQYGSELTPEQTLAVTNELGDVLWYTTRVLNELGFTLEHAVMNARFPSETDSFQTSVLGLVAAVGRVSERVKKGLRDDDGGMERPLGDLRRTAVGDDLLVVMGAFLDTCASVGITIEDAGTANVEKLLDRHSRGKLSGDGDNR